jgi:FHA domain-containing protein
MATLRTAATGCTFELLPETLVGRSPRCQLRLEHESVSHVHASLRHLNGAWRVQDLNSTNGTWVDESCLETGESRLLRVGERLRFGANGSEIWVVTDGSAPRPMILSLPQGVPQHLADGPVSLVGASGQTAASVHWDGVHAVLCESGQLAREIADGEEFAVGGKVFRAFLPALAATAEFECSLSQTELVVLADSSLELHLQGRTHRLAARAPYVVVRELARERLKDRASGVLAADEGWLDRQLLDERLRRPDLNQDIRRIREDFRRLQLFEAARDVIETHRDQGKVRLGIARVRLEQ